MQHLRPGTPLGSVLPPRRSPDKSPTPSPPTAPDPTERRGSGRFGGPEPAGPSLEPSEDTVGCWRPCLVGGGFASLLFNLSFWLFISCSFLETFIQPYSFLRLFPTVHPRSRSSRTPNASLHRGVMPVGPGGCMTGSGLLRWRGADNRASHGSPYALLPWPALPCPGGPSASSLVPASGLYPSDPSSERPFLIARYDTARRLSPFLPVAPSHRPLFSPLLECEFGEHRGLCLFCTIAVVAC